MSSRWQGSLRGRLVLVSAVLLTALLTAAVTLQRSVDANLQRNRGAGQEQRQFAAVLSEFNGAINDAESGLYEYAVLLDGAQRQRVQGAQQRARRELQRLKELAAAHADTRLRVLAGEMETALDRLDQEAGALLKLLGTPEARYPATGLLTAQLHPSNLRFLDAVETALGAAEVSPDKDLRERVVGRLQNIRYHWSQQVSVVRMYVANRSGIFGSPASLSREQLPGRLAYLQEVDADIAELIRLERQGKLGRLQVDTDEMFAARREFDATFNRLVALYESDQWRADVPFFRTRMKPALTEVRRASGELERRLATLTSNSLFESMDTAATLTSFLWLVTSLAAAFVLLTYLAYEYLVRRPIAQVTQALRALEQSSEYAPELRAPTAETEVLLQAFRDMQRQVHARETRLASILDNAGEGIITINEQGIVETFNNAAEQIFGYNEHEVLGRNVALLMPQPLGDQHDNYIRRFVQTDKKQLIGREITLTAQRKDRSLFPMSIKVTDLVLEGHHYFTAIVEDISERKALMDHLRQLAEHDSLTGLHNRQYFLEHLDRVVERAKRQGGLDCALLYIDLDNFKFVNDTLGHQAGDRVLVEVAALLGKRFRRGDVISRLGGDEFAVLLFDVDEAESLAVAEDYRQRLTDYTFRHETHVIDIGCSIGVALLDADVESKEELMSRADISCHTAKRAGRNAVHLYRPRDRQSVVDMSADMSWVRTIKHALEHDRFDFALQPIVNVRTGMVEKREALLRLLDAEGRPIMPSGFVPSAERFGLILDIDRWVVEHAVRLVRHRNRPDEHLSINLSAKSVGDPALLIHATRVLEESGIDPGRLTFEITETVAIADLSAAITLLESLRELGCRTALDDFGAGYSSFAYLKELPVDFVKIDGSFVRSIHEDPVHLAMVKSMNEIAHAMGKQTVAEFVINDRILGKLREIGVDYAQGFYTGAPELAGYPALVDATGNQLSRA